MIVWGRPASVFLTVLTVCPDRVLVRRPCRRAGCVCVCVSRLCCTAIAVRVWVWERRMRTIGGRDPRQTLKLALKIISLHL